MYACGVFSVFPLSIFGYRSKSRLWVILFVLSFLRRSRTCQAITLMRAIVPSDCAWHHLFWPLGARTSAKAELRGQP